MKILDKKNKIYLLDENNFDFPTLDMMKDDLVVN
jgi:leucyl/phenylalanyl-tRNA--protein transferase